MTERRFRHQQTIQDFFELENDVLTRAEAAVLARNQMHTFSKHYSMPLELKDDNSNEYPCGWVFNWGPTDAWLVENPSFDPLDGGPGPILVDARDGSLRQLYSYEGEHSVTREHWIAHRAGGSVKSPVIDILERLGELDWYELHPSRLGTNESVAPGMPVVGFRYQEGNEDRLRLISRCLRNYRGRTSWAVTQWDGGEFFDVGPVEREFQDEDFMWMMPAAIIQKAIELDLPYYRSVVMDDFDADFRRLAREDFFPLLDYLNAQLGPIG